MVLEKWFNIVDTEKKSYRAMGPDYLRNSTFEGLLELGLDLVYILSKIWNLNLHYNSVAVWLEF